MKEEKIALSGMRKIIAERMSQSWNSAPRVMYTVSIDVTNANAYMAKLNEGVDDKSKKVRMNHVLMKACADAMEEYPYVNSSFEEDGIQIHGQVNIGLAVAVPDGLLVPNVKDVLSKDIRALAEETNALVANTRENKITMDDMTGGTFTISNLGMMNIESFSPIINLPEVAILGVDKVEDTPVVENGEVVIRPKMNLNFVADHRVIDGAYAAQYMSKVKELLETL